MVQFETSHEVGIDEKDESFNLDNPSALPPAYNAMIRLLMLAKTEQIFSVSTEVSDESTTTRH